MPKVVDHAARQADLIQALWRVVEREGVSAASVRAVAQEAGVTPGLLRHYFPGHRDLLVQAAQQIGERLQERVTAILGSELDGPEQAVALLEELLPLDSVRMQEAKVWLGWLERTPFDAGFAALRPNAWAGTRSLCRLSLALLSGRTGQEEVDQGVDPQLDERREQQAEQLHTFIDGLTLQVLTFPDQLPPAHARQLLRRYLDTCS